MTRQHTRAPIATQIEQSLARGERLEYICNRLGVTPREVVDARQRIEAACAGDEEDT